MTSRLYFPNWALRQLSSDGVAEPRSTGTPRAAPLDRNVAGVITRHGLLLERAFMLLVNDDEPQPPRRREDRRAGAHDHFHLTRRDALPVPMTLDVAQMTVQHGHPIKPPAEPADRLRSEADLGNQHDRLAAPGHDLLDRR